MVKFSRQHITNSQRKVLLHIAKKGPATKYEIEKATKVNHASVHEAVKKFLSYKIIEGEKVGTTRVGLPKIRYSLNFHGFLAAILNVENLRDIGKIVQKWTHLEPLLLGKWGYLTRKVGRKQVEDFFGRGAKIIETSHNDEEIIKEFREEAVRELFQYLMNIEEWPIEDYIQEYEQTPQQTFKKWIDAFRDNPQLRRLAADYIAETVKSAQEKIDWATNIKREILGKTRRKT